MLCKRCTPSKASFLLLCGLLELSFLSGSTAAFKCNAPSDEGYFVLRQNGASPSQMGGSGTSFDLINLQDQSHCDTAACAGGYSCGTLIFTGDTFWSWGNPSDPDEVVAVSGCLEDTWFGPSGPSCRIFARDTRGYFSPSGVSDAAKPMAL